MANLAIGSVLAFCVTHVVIVVVDCQGATEANGDESQDDGAH